MAAPWVCRETSDAAKLRLSPLGNPPSPTFRILLGIDFSIAIREAD